MSNAASALLAAKADAEAAAQAISSLAAALNAAVDTSTIDAVEAETTRDVLMSKIISSAVVETVDEVERVTRVGNMLVAVTARPSQLSTQSTDDALDMATTLATTATSDRVLTSGLATRPALQSVASLVSNLVLACSEQKGLESRMRRASNTIADIVDSLSTSLLSNMIPVSRNQLVAF